MQVNLVVKRKPVFVSTGVGYIFGAIPSKSLPLRECWILKGPERNFPDFSLQYLIEILANEKWKVQPDMMPLIVKSSERWEEAWSLSIIWF